MRSVCWFIGSRRPIHGPDGQMDKWAVRWSDEQIDDPIDQWIDPMIKSDI
jgi:hypothetical protein